VRSALLLFRSRTGGHFPTVGNSRMISSPEAGP
jgi:hypothetical protein